MPHLRIGPKKPGCFAAGLFCLGNVLCVAQTHALDIGFQGELSLEASDNIDGVNPPNEEDGLIQSAVLGVFGEQRGRIATFGFSGELDTRRTSTDDDSDITTVSRFLGAAEFKLTPRVLTWYVGDILGGVRADNGLQAIDDTQLTRRNVFVTGPEIEFEQVGISRTNARALFVTQSQDAENLEDLYTVSFRHERDINTGSFYGINLGNIYTDVSDDNDDLTDASDDFNRASASVFYNRTFGVSSIFGQLGVTRFDTDIESLQGLSAELRATRQITPVSSISAFVTRDLNDETLTTVQTLLTGGIDAVGLEPDTAGIFTETRIGATYFYQTTNRSVTLQAGVAQLDFELLTGAAQNLFSADSEDRDQVFASATWSQLINQRFSFEADVSYESQDFRNIEDNSESVISRLDLIYALSTSFELALGYTNDTASGLLTRFTNADGGVIDVTENRLELALRWAPPSRATQDLTVELRSLLQ